MIVAIDGPAGAGKSTVARQVAAALGYTYIDTGAMYRAVALRALQEGVDVSDIEILEKLAAALHIVLSPLTSDGRQIVALDGEDVTDAIRAPSVAAMTSAVSAIPEVRRVIVEQQRRMGRNATGVVMEGRDIGTVVFPDAEIKIFLTASPEVRARRRFEELTGRGVQTDYETTLAEQRERDERDSHRADSPLRAASDAIPISTDDLPIEEVTARILTLCREGRASGGAE